MHVKIDGIQIYMVSWSHVGRQAITFVDMHLRRHNMFSHMEKTTLCWDRVFEGYTGPI